MAPIRKLFSTHDHDCRLFCLLGNYFYWSNCSYRRAKIREKGRFFEASAIEGDVQDHGRHIQALVGENTCASLVYVQRRLCGGGRGEHAQTDGTGHVKIYACAAELLLGSYPNPPSNGDRAVHL